MAVQTLPQVANRDAAPSPPQSQLVYLTRVYTSAVEQVAPAVRGRGARCRSSLVPDTGGGVDVRPGQPEAFGGSGSSVDPATQAVHAAPTPRLAGHRNRRCRSLPRPADEPEEDPNSASHPS